MNFTKEEKDHRWKGDRAGYSAIHMWVLKWKGNPPHCEVCGKEGKKTGRRWSIEWANIDGKYRRILDDFIGMCRSCHCIYDGNLKYKHHPNQGFQKNYIPWNKGKSYKHKKNR